MMQLMQCGGKLKINFGYFKELAEKFLLNTARIYDIIVHKEPVGLDEVITALVITAATMVIY